jgi:hypothetical protein
MPRLPLLACLLLSMPLQADVLRIPVGEQAAGLSIALPERGQRQLAVLERFGLPDEEHPAVGNPPITRWDYREFSVYFESGVVINSVVHHHPRPAETIIIEEQE